jgi:PTH1 family peptidyl-tRNA hydrolase
MSLFRLFKQEKMPQKVDWLVVGLGNPGRKYENTRHNAGFQVLDQWVSLFFFFLKASRQFRCNRAAQAVGGQQLLFVKPQTYMNLSGESVKPLCRAYQRSTQQLVVVYDDVALPVGKLRIRKSGSSGGHNGMKSIIRHLENAQDFPRIRIGVGAPEDKSHMVSHVLGPFSVEEGRVLQKVYEAVMASVAHITNDEIEQAMNLYNGVNFSEVL